ncbi:MAG: hypothetical protein JWO36_1866 [Myxococcales bacterium]|nr:hypothetical protein [Myxococcales bacterium]
MTVQFRLVSGVVCGVLACSASVASAWGIGSQLDERGCHESITAQALRNVRAQFSATALTFAPTRDEAALIADVQFAPPADLVPDLGGMSLLLGVRDNDLKGQNPLSTLDLVQVHGNPATQMEHCIRGATDDDAAGNQTGLATCSAFIVDRATEALDGLDSRGAVDPTKRMPLLIYVSIAGQVSPALPLFYVKMGQAMHALEDGFTHTYRTSDGSRVTVMLNWIDWVGTAWDQGRDGPPHRVELDHCANHDPLIQRNFTLATQAATELLSASLDPALTRVQKIAAFTAVTAKYLSFESGCTLDNGWCDAPEAHVTEASTFGCNTSGGGLPWLTIVLLTGGLLLARRLRRRMSMASPLVALAAVLALMTTRAYADDPAPPSPPKTAGDKPAVPTAPTTVNDVKDAQKGQEPGREVKTPTVTEVKAIREDKRLGNAFGFAASLGASVDRGAGVMRIGGRYRLSEKWVFGVDAEWNPWFTSAPMKMRAGVMNEYLTVIRRFPMKFDRVNLRTSLHLGVSTLLFDVYGAPKYSTGPAGSISLLGIDYDLGNSVRLVIDPAEITVAVPMLGTIPLAYEQFRLMIGLQIGA